jgi:hypothetical protein
MITKICDSAAPAGSFLCVVVSTPTRVITGYLLCCLALCVYGVLLGSTCLSDMCGLSGTPLHAVSRCVGRCRCYSTCVSGFLAATC